MSWLRSFRTRFIAGSIAWGLGLALLVHVVSVLIFVGRSTFQGRWNIVWLIAVALASMGGGVWLAASGLKTFTRLRNQLSAVHDGRQRQVQGTYPTEIRALVDDLNVLLAHRDTRVREALAKAGDLAHGLKTPLAVLAHEAERAGAAGHEELATLVQQQVNRMHRHVDYHLAHARAAASGAMPGARAAVAESAEGLRRTLGRLHAGRNLQIEIDIPAEHAVQGQREDLDEMLGNLLDNACKWARSRVAISSSNGSAGVTITIDDDGPGLREELRDVVLQRGVRADEAAPGSGLGLAIVRDLAEVYGGSVVLETSPLGGLRARLQLPSA